MNTHSLMHASHGTWQIHCVLQISFNVKSTFLVKEANMIIRANTTYLSTNIRNCPFTLFSVNFPHIYDEMFPIGAFAICVLLLAQMICHWSPHDDCCKVVDHTWQTWQHTTRDITTRDTRHTQPVWYPLLCGKMQQGDHNSSSVSSYMQWLITGLSTSSLPSSKRWIHSLRKVVPCQVNHKTTM